MYLPPKPIELRVKLTYIHNAGNGAAADFTRPASREVGLVAIRGLLTALKLPHCKSSTIQFYAGEAVQFSWDTTRDSVLHETLKTQIQAVDIKQARKKYSIARIDIYVVDKPPPSSTTIFPVPNSVPFNIATAPMLLPQYRAYSPSRAVLPPVLDAPSAPVTGAWVPPVLYQTSPAPASAVQSFPEAATQFSASMSVCQAGSLAATESPKESRVPTVEQIPPPRAVTPRPVKPKRFKNPSSSIASSLPSSRVSSPIKEQDLMIVDVEPITEVHSVPEPQTPTGEEDMILVSSPAPGLGGRSDQIDMLSAELAEIRRDLGAKFIKAREIAAALQILGCEIPQNSVELSVEERAFVQQAVAEHLEQELEHLRDRRREVESAIKEVAFQKRPPFVCPALLNVFVGISRLGTMALEAVDSESVQAVGS